MRITRLSARGKAFAWLVWLLFAVSFANQARAEGIAAPPLKSGQFVYTVPRDFDPPYIGKSGLNEIEREARRLRFPYYVVIVQDYGGSTDEELSDAVDALADDWAKNPKFNRATSSIAVLSYSPRKYRFLAGSTWRAKLGLEGQGGQRFVDIFSSYIQGSSKDPKSGIIESMKALDAFVVEQTDPKRIARREQAARKVRAQQQLQSARSSLDGQINRTENLLGQTQFLPADTSSPRAALRKAKALRASNIVAALLAAASELESETRSLDAFVGAKRRAMDAQLAEQERVRQVALEKQQVEQKRQQLQKTKTIAFLLGTALLLGALLVWQWRRFKSVSTIFREKTAAWDESLLNAANNHTRFFEERQSVTELANTTGQTRAKYDEVTREVGAIYPTIEAMRDRVEECKRIFAGGSFLRVKPLQNALALLDADFEFDTETIHRRSLFEPPVRIIKIKPAELQSQLQQQYGENIADWDELMQALKLREIIAQDAFSPGDLTQLLDLATQKGIPHRWLSTHPLFGDEASDRRFYEDLNALRLSDPLAYKHRIDAAVGVENGLKSVLSRLIAALDGVESKRVRVLPAYGETVVAAPDDPALTLASAFRADERLSGFLASKTRVEDVEEQASLAAGLYQKAVEQAATLQAAIKGIEGDIENFALRLDTMRELQNRAQARLEEARIVHVDTASPAAALESGRRFVDLGAGLLQNARQLLGEKRHLESQKMVQEANGHLASAENDLHGCLQGCDELDEQKRAYEMQIARLEMEREDAEARIRRYGRTHRFGDYGDLQGSGPANYGALMLGVNTYRQQLEDEVRSARRAFEEEQARLEREREAQRQRERDEERRRRSSSSSGSSWSSSRSSSSSSGSSWSGGSSSSSGTDW